MSYEVVGNFSGRRKTIVVAAFAKHLERQLNAERALADRLAGEIQWIAKEPEGATTWRMAHVAKEALAAWKEARK